MSVALGWMILTNKKGKTLYFHNGATGGYTSSMALDIEHKKGIVVLTNINFRHPNSKNLDVLCFILIDLD